MLWIRAQGNSSQFVQTKESIANSMNSSPNSRQNLMFLMFFYGREHFGALWTTDLPVEIQLLWAADVPMNVSSSLRLYFLSSNLTARPILKKIGLREIFWNCSFLCQILYPGASLYSWERMGMGYDRQTLRNESTFQCHNHHYMFLSWLQRPLNRNHPHSKMYSWWFQKILFSFENKNKSQTLLFQLCILAFWHLHLKVFNTFEVRDLRFFRLLRVHGLVDLNVPRMFCAFSHRKSSRVTAQYHVREMLLQGLLSSRSLAAWNLLRPTGRLLSFLVSCMVHRRDIRKAYFLKKYLFTFINFFQGEWKSLEIKSQVNQLAIHTNAAPWSGWVCSDHWLSPGKVVCKPRQEMPFDPQLGKESF